MDPKENQKQPTQAMDKVPSNADEYVGEPLPDGDHDLEADSFADHDPEDVAIDEEANGG